jgi:hypothetical protein
MENLPPLDANQKPLPSFSAFPRTTPFVVVLLTLVTLGFYVPWWLYTRTRVLNRLLPASPVPSLPMAFCMGGYLMLLVMITQIPAGMDAVQIMDSPEFSRLMDAAMFLNLVQLVWATLFLQRLNLCTHSKPGDTLYGSFFILVLAHFFVVSVFYLQHKINQIADHQRKPDVPGGILQA